MFLFFNVPPFDDALRNISSIVLLNYNRLKNYLFYLTIDNNYIILNQK